MLSRRPGHPGLPEELGHLGLLEELGHLGLLEGLGEGSHLADEADAWRTS